MVRFKSSWPVPLLLGLYFVAGVGPAAAQHPDPWQFPQVTKQQPFRRAWWFFEQRAFPLGYIPLGVRERALQQIEQAEARQAGQAARQRPAPGQAAAPAPAQQPTTQQASAPQTAAAAAQGSSWTNIGPAPIQVPPIPRAVSGRVADIAVHPTNSNHWLIGSAQGGVWQTLDAGATWTPLTDDQASLAMGAIAFAPSDPNIIYAGTGEAVFAGDAYGGAGLLKSTNGGASWQLLAAGTFARTSFSDIKVNPANANVLLAATTMGIAGRLEAPPPAMPSRGIFKSVDGGLTWSQTLNGEATDLEADPTDFNRVYGAIGSIFGGTGNGVYRSANAGDTWTLIQGPWSTMAGGVGRVEMAIAPSNPNVLYISIHATSTGGLLGLFRTDNAWAPTPAFIQIDTSPTGPQGYCAGGGEFQCWYDHEIVVDPVDPNVLYAGGIGLWKCTNCGASPTWSFLNPVHSDQQTMAWAGGRLIVGSDGGVWSTTDGGATWNDHNTSLSITQFYAGSLHPTDPSFALGGSQDNGTEKWTGLDAWQFV